MDHNVRDTRSSDVMRRGRSHTVDGDADQAGSTPALQHPPFDAYHQQAHVLQNREKIARLLRLFSSPRKRLGLTPDELLIFFAIGYLSTTMLNGAIHVIPIGMIDVSGLLGIPKETVRRKTMRLVDLEYVGSTPKGVFIKEVRVWCQMLERAVS
jgi:hypothetical protein